MNLETIQVIDSHTAGEPTRIIYNSNLNLAGNTVAEQLDILRNNHDYIRQSVVLEPRGFDAMVGGIICKPADPKATAGIIFFNNDGYLGMCGHGTIGLITTLAYLGQIQTGDHFIETPVGTVRATLNANGEVTVDNVVSYRSSSNVIIPVTGYSPVTGDVAWGGNWFFLVSQSELDIYSTPLDDLTNYAWEIRQSLAANGITGDDGAEIDHIELFANAKSAKAHSRNFVLCPGKVYDRSPCGTGTSAKMACLYADGKLAVGQNWLQESVIGSLFRGSIHVDDGEIYPSITGRAFITSQSTLLFDENDPFKQGIVV